MSKDHHNSFLVKLKDNLIENLEENKEINEDKLGSDSHQLISSPMAYIEVDKILGGKTFAGKLLKYFVKWKNLEYEDCTWEYPNFIESIAPKQLLKYRRQINLRNKLLIRNYANKLIDHHHKPRNPLFKDIISHSSFIKEGNLSPQQIENLNWIASSWHKGNNVILTDENGVGKTIETISFLSYLMNIQKITRPFLIITGKSRIHEWEKELTKWIPEANIVLLQGSDIS